MDIVQAGLLNNKWKTWMIESSANGAVGNSQKRQVKGICLIVNRNTKLTSSNKVVVSLRFLLREALRQDL